MANYRIRRNTEDGKEVGYFIVEREMLIPIPISYVTYLDPKTRKYWEAINEFPTFKEADHFVKERIRVEAIVHGSKVIAEYSSG